MTTAHPCWVPLTYQTHIKVRIEFNICFYIRIHCIKHIDDCTAYDSFWKPLPLGIYKHKVNNDAQCQYKIKYSNSFLHETFRLRVSQTNMASDVGHPSRKPTCILFMIYLLLLRLLSRTLRVSENMLDRVFTIVTPL